MRPWIWGAIVGISVAGCLWAWFRDVRRVMRSLESTVESAAKQLLICRKKAQDARNDLESTVVLVRSEKIYQQAVQNYNEKWKKPWVCVPAVLMGFRAIRK